MLVTKKYSQGSLLGPPCFLIFYNDFPVARNDGQSVVYADDDTDNVSSDSPQNLQMKIQAEADSSVQWLNDNNGRLLILTSLIAVFVSHLDGRNHQFSFCCALGYNESPYPVIINEHVMV